MFTEHLLRARYCSRCSRYYSVATALNISPFPHGNYSLLTGETKKCVYPGAKCYGEISRVRGQGRVVQGIPEGLSEEVAFKQRADGNEGLRRVGIWERAGREALGVWDSACPPLDRL